MDIEGKVAVITGGASGLGAATARRFTKAGGRIAIFDLNDELGAAMAAELGDGASYHRVNVADEESVAAAIGEPQGGIVIAQVERVANHWVELKKGTLVLA